MQKRSHLLRWLLLVSVLLIVLFPVLYFGVRFRRAQQFATNLEAVGGGAYFDIACPEWLWHWADEHNVQRYLHGLETRVTKIDLSNTSIDDHWLQKLNAWDEIEELNLGATAVTSAGLLRLPQLRRLKFAELMSTNVDDQAMKFFDQTEQLEHLNMGNTPVTDSGVIHLRNCPNLKSLYLWHTRVTGSGLKDLPFLSKLSSLDLSDTLVDDAGLAFLESAHELEELSLDDTQVTNAGLRHLRNCRKLKTLSLRNTKVGPEAKAELEKLYVGISVDLESDSPQSLEAKDQTKIGSGDPWTQYRIFGSGGRGGPHNEWRHDEKNAMGMGGMGMF